MTRDEMIELLGWHPEINLLKDLDTLSGVERIVEVAVLRERNALRKACNWWEEDGAWTTGCAKRFVLEAGAPEENSMSYCCYCGGILKEVEA